MIYRALLLASLPLAGLLTSGCASTAAETRGTATMATEKDAIIAEREQRIATLEESLRETETRLASAGDTALFPPAAKPGQCYARVLLPATYRSTDERVLLKEAAERIETVPAQFETVMERVLVREASKRIEVVPAQYEEVQEQVLVRPASTRLEEVPASYRTVTEQVLDKPAHTVWKRGPASQFGAANVLDTRQTDTGEIMCLVEVPAAYRTITRQVLETPAQVREMTVPAEYRTVTRTVLKTPATTREVEIPAEYAMVEVTREVRKPQSRRVEIPAEYGTVTKREKVTDERLEWREVVCDVNLTAGNVRSLQQALGAKGYYGGPLDGVIGPLTLKAANDYAEARGLPGGSNYIAVEVVDALGLSI